MIKPTVGRVVLFHPMVEHDQPYAALVTYVHSDTMVNLVVFGPAGGVYPNNQVPLMQDDAEAPSTGFYAEWMPYQKGQAAKNDQDVKDLEGRTGDLEVALHSQAGTIIALRDELAHTQTALDALQASIHGPEPGLGVAAAETPTEAPRGPAGDTAPPAAGSPATEAPPGPGAAAGPGAPGVADVKK